jgi:hypothetical protein
MHVNERRKSEYERILENRGLCVRKGRKTKSKTMLTYYP